MKKTFNQLTQRLDEILTKSTPAGEWIHDFVHSDNPKFAGKSAAKRKQMALAAYYAKKNESVEESAAVSQNSTPETMMNEERDVHVNDGSKYDEEPHPKDVEHVMAGVKKYGGKHAGNSDKGVFFRFKSKEDADSFRAHVNKCPHHSCDADHVEESVEYKGIGTDVVDKKKVLNPQPNLLSTKKTVKDFKEEVEELDELDKKTIGSYAKKATKDLKWQQTMRPFDTKRIQNREKGIDTAIDKLTKEEVEEIEEGDNGLAAKAKKSGVSLSTLKTVYKRGVAAWNSGHRPGTTPAQWGMARVNSYITKGSGTYGGADKDLHEDARLHKAEYQKGMSASMAKARVAHWRKADKMSDSNPKAYEPAPGDKTAKTTPSVYTKKYHAMYGEAKVYDPFTKKMVNTKPIKVKMGGGATRNGVPVETGPSKYKERPSRPGDIYGKSFTEEVEQIDELSKTTLQSYRKKVAKDVGRAYAIHQDPYKKTDKDDMRKLSNRVKGDERAEIGLKKEDVQIDEVSKATLMRYIPAASRAAAQHVYTGKEAQTWAGHHMRAGDYAASDRQLATSKSELGKSVKRLKGIDTATKKLGTKKTYEEFVRGLEEGYDHGPIDRDAKLAVGHKAAVLAGSGLDSGKHGTIVGSSKERTGDMWHIKTASGDIVKMHKHRVAKLKEEVEQIEEATVASRKYDWGTMKTVHHGKSFSIPLHPEHHEPIAKLKHGESHSFKDETGRKWKATREHDTVHFHGGSYGTQKTSVRHEKLQESLEEKHSHEVIPGTQVKPNLTRVKTTSKVLKKEEVAESRGHKVLATFFKNREIAQRAAQGDKQTPKYLEKGIETPEKDAVEKKKMLGLKEDQYAADYKIKYYVDPITGENKTRKIRPHRVDFAASKMRAEPAQKDAQGDYGIKEGFLTPSIEADMKNLSAYEYLKKYGKHKSQHRQSLKTRPEDLKEGGFDNYDEIAKELIRRHGKNVDTGHIHDIEGERDTHRGLDHAEVMAHVKKHLKEEDPFPRDEKWTELKPKHIKGAK